MTTKSERDHPASKYGTDKEFLKFVSYQPSVLDGSFNQWDTNTGEGRNIACHVRRVSRGSGMGTKPPYSAVAMTDKQHQLQGKSERECLDLYVPFGAPWSDGEAAAYFELKADEMLERWIQSVKKTRLKVK